MGEGLLEKRQENEMYTADQLRRDLSESARRPPKLMLGDGKWGERGWVFLYTCVLAFDGDIADLHAFMKHLGAVLPCKECTEHYRTYLRANDLPGTRAGVFEWLEGLEREVAGRKGKRFESRLSSIRRKSSNKNKLREGKKERKYERKECIDCNRPRSELGASPASVGLSASGARGFRPARSIGIAPR